MATNLEEQLMCQAKRFEWWSIAIDEHGRDRHSFRAFLQEALANERGTFADELSDPKFWLENALLADIMTHMNELNTNLEGK